MQNDVVTQLTVGWIDTLNNIVQQSVALMICRWDCTLLSANKQPQATNTDTTIADVKINNNSPHEIHLTCAVECISACVSAFNYIIVRSQAFFFRWCLFSNVGCCVLIVTKYFNGMSCPCIRMNGNVSRMFVTLLFTLWILHENLAN